MKQLVFNPLLSSGLDYIGSDTLAQLPTIATARILGRVTTGSGAPEELTIAQVLGMAGLATSITAGKTLTFAATDDYTFTIGATMTAAGQNYANIFTAAQKIDVNSATALCVEQDGVKDNTFIVDTKDGRIGVNCIPTVVQENYQPGGVGTILLKGDTGGAFTFSDLSGPLNAKYYQWRSENGFASLNLINDSLTGITRKGIIFINSSGLVTINTGNYDSDTGLTSRFGVIGSTDTNQIKVVGFTTQTLPVGYIIDNTAATNTVRNVLQLETQSTGTAAAGLGAGLLFSIKTATAGTMQNAGQIAAIWTDATNATRKAYLSLSAYDTAQREGLRISADGVAGITKTFAAVEGAYTTTAVNLTLTSAHHWVKVTAACTITLPACSGLTGREYIITATADNVVVDGNASETIDGETTQTLYAYETIQIKTDGSNWFVI